jgi:lipid II:glycine glycyltransferase (peptidoglycan interpeptide bridge formation enzyme)
MESIGGMAKEIEIIDYIKQIYKENEDYKVYIAKYKNKIVAGLLVFYFKKTVEYYMPVINNEFRNLQALSLLIFEAMTEASVFGFKNWNWGGTWESQKGVYSFKKKWGTNDNNYYYLTKLNNEEIYTLDEDTLLSEYSNFYVVPFKNLLKNE